MAVSPSEYPADLHGSGSLDVIHALASVAGRTLALDLATGEVVRAFDAAGIDCLLLKGPSMVHRLYGDDPTRRNYSDIDLAVDPCCFAAAGRVLATMGFQDRRAGIRASEAAREQERPWHRDGPVYVRVDLHRGFHGVTDWVAWWDLLQRHREVISVEGQSVAIPDRVGCALVAALHASKSSSMRKAVEDLRRALGALDDDVWRQAADLAHSVGAGAAFVAALGRLPAGVELTSRLGLGVPASLPRFRATSPAHGTGSFSVLLEAPTWTGRARALRDIIFPSTVVLANVRPIATCGRGGLTLAYVARLGFIVRRVPTLLLAWRRAARP